MDVNSLQSSGLTIHYPKRERKGEAMRKKSIPKTILSAVVKTQTRKNTIAANAAMYEFIWGEKPSKKKKKN